MRRFLLVLVLLALGGAGLGLFLTRATPLDAAAFEGVAGDPVKGEQVFWAAGCASCHAAPEARDEAKLVLAGGQQFPSDFGTFIAPNISPDPEHGIGGWSLAEFATAVTAGVSPEGQHYYPAFPYGAYNKMALSDVADMKAFMDTLPASDTPSQPHRVGFPFNIRRSIGGWKLLFLNDDWMLDDLQGQELVRGRYLVEALAHCGECHTPRNALGGMEADRWMAGAPNPSGRGTIPNITPAKLTWNASEIAYYLETGFTPDFDSAGGHMAAVISNMAKLPPEDRAAIAAYVKALPPAE